MRTAQAPPRRQLAATVAWTGVPSPTPRYGFHCQDEGIGIQTQCSEYSVPYKLVYITCTMREGTPSVELLMTVLFWVVQSADSGISVLLVLQLHAMGWGYKCENLEINKGTSCLAFIYPLGSDCITWPADHWCLRHLLVDGTRGVQASE
ncbi:uncharacterized protein LOC119327765 [Triticum dicoccoides]|uniref:uncharacterized protein LOC119327765 n=1 Tax=Triticum dicoccoides TaxID=85692 RepID=UPI001891D2E6|nr:uncharacterized protein LOC119327765 [Triticum dicoccoides]